MLERRLRAASAQQVAEMTQCVGWLGVCGEAHIISEHSGNTTETHTTDVLQHYVFRSAHDLQREHMHGVMMTEQQGIQHLSTSEPYSSALRASIALGPNQECPVQVYLGAPSVPEAEEEIRINSSRPKNSGGFARRIERSAGVIGDSETGVTSFWASCGVRAFKGTRGSDDDAVPEISSGSRSLYSVRGVVCQPDKTKQLERFGPS